MTRFAATASLSRIYPILLPYSKTPREAFDAPRLVAARCRLLTARVFKKEDPRRIGLTRHCERQLEPRGRTSQLGRHVIRPQVCLSLAPLALARLPTPVTRSASDWYDRPLTSPPAARARAATCKEQQPHFAPPALCYLTVRSRTPPSHTPHTTPSLYAPGCCASHLPDVPRQLLKFTTRYPRHRQP